MALTVTRVTSSIQYDDVTNANLAYPTSNCVARQSLLTFAIPLPLIPVGVSTGGEGLGKLGADPEDAADAVTPGCLCGLDLGAQSGRGAPWGQAGRTDRLAGYGRRLTHRLLGFLGSFIPNDSVETERRDTVKTSGGQNVVKNIDFWVITIISLKHS